MLLLPDQVECITTSLKLSTFWQSLYNSRTATLRGPLLALHMLTPHMRVRCVLWAFKLLPVCGFIGVLARQIYFPLYL